MNIGEVELKVKEMIAYQLGIRENDISTHYDLIEDLGADSLDLIELLMDLECEFEQEISDEDAEKFKIVQDIINYVHEASK